MKCPGKELAIKDRGRGLCRLSLVLGMVPPLADARAKNVRGWKDGGGGEGKPERSKGGYMHTYR